MEESKEIQQMIQQKSELEKVLLQLYNEGDFSGLNYSIRKYENNQDLLNSLLTTILANIKKQKIKIQCNQFLCLLHILELLEDKKDFFFRIENSVKFMSVLMQHLAKTALFTFRNKNDLYQSFHGFLKETSQLKTIRQFIQILAMKIIELPDQIITDRIQETKKELYYYFLKNIIEQLSQDYINKKEFENIFLPSCAVSLEKMNNNPQMKHNIEEQIKKMQFREEIGHEASNLCISSGDIFIPNTHEILKLLHEIYAQVIQEYLDIQMQNELLQQPINPNVQNIQIQNIQQ